MTSKSKDGFSVPPLGYDLLSSRKYPGSKKQLKQDQFGNLLLGIACAESTCFFFLSPIIFSAQLQHRLHANVHNVKRIQYTSLPLVLGI